ncbi:MAG: hypothetical protein V1702_04410 [Candidatus Woesearchaeota archaeon]
MKMEEAWFRKEGFYSNPFSIKPAAFHDEIIGYKLEPVMQRIDDGAVLFVEAPLGSGKTTLTKRIIRNLKGKSRIIYHSHMHSERINVGKLLKGASFSAKVFGMLPKGAVMLVDEAAEIRPEDGEEILKFVEQGNLKSAVFFGTKYFPKRFPEGLAKLINGNVVKLSYLTPEQAVQMIRRRIGSLKLITDDMIRQAFVRVNYNPRRLLEACEDICREAALGTTAKTEIVEKVLGSMRPVKASAPAERKSRKSAKKQPSASVVIHEVHVGAEDNFDLKNIRTYEEEMELIRQQAEEKES